MEKNSRKWILEALIILMKEKSFDKISVTDITQKAGVARLTFYRNYETKEDVLLDYFKKRLEQYLLEMQSSERLNLEKMLEACFMYWSDDKLLLQLMVKQELMSLLFIPFIVAFESVIKYSLDNKEYYSETQIEFIKGGLFMVMLYWIKMPETEKINSHKIANDILLLVNTQ